MPRSFWWQEPKNMAHLRIVETLRTLRDRQQQRYLRNLRNMRLYDNRVAMGMYGDDYVSYADDGALKMNICKAVVDTAIAHIATTKPRPLFLTERGNWDARTRAKNLSKFVLGQFYQNHQYEIGVDVAYSCFIFGTGIEKIYAGKKDVMAERVFPDEIRIDDRDALYGRPRQWFHVKEASKSRLKQLYPDSAGIIELSTLLDVHESSWGQAGDDDTVTLMEAWLCGSDEEAGRHVICVGEGTILDKPYPHEKPPLAFFRMVRPQRGFFGASMVDDLVDIQVETNYILEKIQRLMTLATSQIWAEKGSIINKNLNNEDWTFNEFRGRPPIFMAVQSVSPEYFQQLDRLWGRGFELVGVSQLHATAQKPAGLDSGEAQRVYNDIASARFRAVHQNFEQFHIDAAKLYIAGAKEIYNRDNSYAVRAPGDRSLERLDFGKVHLEEDSYIMKAYPAALLPEEPSGRLQTISEIGQQFPQAQPYLLSHLRAPDVESMISEMNAEFEIADLLIEEMLVHGKRQHPEPWMDLATLEMRVNRALLRAQIEGAPEENLQLAREFIEEIQLQLSGMAPPALPAEAMPMSPEMAMQQPGVMPPDAAMMAPPVAA